MQRDKKRELFDFINYQQKALKELERSITFLALRERELQTDLEGLETTADSIWTAYVSRRPQDELGRQRLKRMLEELRDVKLDLLRMIRGNGAELQSQRRERQRLEMEITWKQMLAGIPFNEVVCRRDSSEERTQDLEVSRPNDLSPESPRLPPSDAPRGSDLGGGALPSLLLLY